MLTRVLFLVGFAMFVSIIDSGLIASTNGNCNSGFRCTQGSCTGHTCTNDNCSCPG